MPHQLAVAVAGGAEGLIHAGRQWIAIQRREEDMVLLQNDMKILPEEFLYDCRRFAPASTFSRNIIMSLDQISYMMGPSIRLIGDIKDAQ